MKEYNIITTAKGRKFEYDKITSTSSPARMFIHLINTDIATAAAVFTDPEELPLQGHRTFKQFDSIFGNENGVDIILKR